MPNIGRRAVAYDSRNRLLLNALLKGLSYAIRRDDILAANRYRGRVQQAAEPVAADTLLKGPLTKLLLTTGLWVEVANVDAMKRGNNCLISSIKSSLCLHHDRQHPAPRVARLPHHHVHSPTEPTAARSMTRVSERSLCLYASVWQLCAPGCRGVAQGTPGTSAGRGCIVAAAMTPGSQPLDAAALPAVGDSTRRESILMLGREQSLCSIEQSLCSIK